MHLKDFSNNLVYRFFKLFLSLQENKSRDIGTPKKILIVRQHNQLGDLLASISLFRAFKEKFPLSHLTLIVSRENIDAVNKNRFIDRVILWDKKNIFNIKYLLTFYKILSEEYDIAIVPVLVSISFTSNLIARFSNSKIRIGCNSLNGIVSKSNFLFDLRVDLDWRKIPDSNVTDRILDNVRPFGVDTKIFTAEINYDKKDVTIASEFIEENKLNKKNILIGIHPGAGKTANRWLYKNFKSLIEKLNLQFDCSFYLTGSNADNIILKNIANNCGFKIPIFFNKKISEVAAIIANSDLFITNDTGIMHVAGATATPQISIFGPTNPFNWAPIGKNKYFIQNSDLIDDVSVEDVFNLAVIILLKNNKVLTVE